MNVAAMLERHAARYPHTPAGGSTAHSGLVYIPHAKSFSPTTMNRPEAHATADHRQADYFLRMLTERYRLIEQRIDECQREIASADASGDVAQLRRSRRRMRTDERERRAVNRLIDNLRRRFFAGAPDEVSPISRRARLVVR